MKLEHLWVLPEKIVRVASGTRLGVPQAGWNREAPKILGVIAMISTHFWPIMEHVSKRLRVRCRACALRSDPHNRPGAVMEIYRYGPGREIKTIKLINQKWYPYQNRWYLYHSAREIKTPKPGRDNSVSYMHQPPNGLAGALI